MWYAGHASTAARGTPPATPPGVPPRWSTPVRACRLAREDGRMFCCCHIDVGPHAVDDNPVARSEAMPRRSLRQFTNISNMKRLVEARNPAAYQWRFAFHAIRFVGAIELLAELDRSSSKFVPAGLCSMQTPGVRHMSLQRSAPRSGLLGRGSRHPG